MTILASRLFLCLMSFAIVLQSDAVIANARYVPDRAQGKSQVIVFVHGVIGDGTSTWTNDATKAYWPDLVATDPTFGSANIYVYEFPSLPVGRSLSINELAEAMRRRLEADEVTAHAEMIFISHSMGGLVTRQFLIKYRDHAAKVKMAYFLATPTEGSPTARLAALASRNPQFKNMYPMDADSYLANLQRDWLAAHLGIRSFCAYEGMTTYGVQIVDQRSASNLCTEALDPILENHIDIVKPRDRSSDSYIAVKNAYIKNSRDGNYVPQADRIRTDHPVILPSIPIAEQIQLFPEDRVRVFGPASIRQVRFGGEWEPLNTNRTYIVVGAVGHSVTPEFSPTQTGLIKLEVEYNKYVDRPRDLGSARAVSRRSTVVLFAPGLAVLSADEKLKIDTQVLSAALSAGDFDDVIVGGHADPEETPDQRAAQMLSENRAAAVLAYLVSKGVSMRKIETLGLGKTMPLAEVNCKNVLAAERSNCYRSLRGVDISIHRQVIKK